MTSGHFTCHFVTSYIRLKFRVRSKSWPFTAKITMASRGVELTFRLIAGLLLTAVPMQVALSQSHPTRGVIDGVVSDTNLVPLKDVEVTIQRTSLRVATGENGRFRVSDVPSGSYLLVARRIGFRPVAQLAAVVEDDTLRVSILMETSTPALDTVRINAGHDPTGFAWRRSLKVGQFITAADIERENPRTTTDLIRTRDAMRYSFDKNGNPFVAMTAGASERGNCKPFEFLDGFPLPPSAPRVTGVPSLDWALHPDEIGGVEIYVNPSQVPAQFRSFRGEDKFCGVIVYWTREKLGIAPTLQKGRPR